MASKAVWRSVYWVPFTIALLALIAFAQASDRLIRVARLSLIEGEVNYQRAEDGDDDGRRDEWYEATANLPLDERNQLYTGSDGRAEIQLMGGNIIRINRNTNLRFLEFNTATMQFALPVGTATVRIESLDRRRLQIVNANSVDDSEPIYFEIDTPLAAVVLKREGSYRINVGDDGSTEVIVREGEAEVFSEELGTVRVRSGRRMIVEADNAGEYRVARLEDKDWWDQWNDRRDAELFARRDRFYSRHLPAYIAGGQDLDHYGEWIETPEYGWIWSPHGVDINWAPYRHGCWRWYPSYGWTWVAHEPWGWAPYHYGRWAYYRNRWCWVPRTYGAGWVWSPSLVVFFGRGYRDGFRDGYREGIRDGIRDGRHGWVGWVPLGPGDRFEQGDRVVAARRPEEMQNYGAPGGFGGVEGGRFDRSRVVVHNATTPPVSTGTVSAAEFAPIARGELRPVDRFETGRPVPAARRTLTGRSLDAPLVARRPVQINHHVARPQTESGGRAIGDTRTNSSGSSGASRGRRDGDVPAQAPSGAVSAPSRSVEVEDRPGRAPEFRPPQRTSPPEERAIRDRRSSESNSAPTSRPSDRTIQNRPAPSGPPPSSPPARTEAPRRVEPRPQSPPAVRAPDRPQKIERSRESSPPRQVERPAPSKPVERPVERQRPSRPINQQ